jgi:hypothetical protein
VEFATQASLQAAMAASPIDLADNIKIVVEERRKSGKTGDGKTGKQLTADRRAGTKSDEGRGVAAKKLGRSASGSGSGSQKPRTD